MEIAIIGAGPTGLLLGLRLSQKGHQITIFEKEKEIGGLTKTFKEKDWVWPVEKFYHHLFSSDKAAQKIISQLGLKKKLLYLNPKTSILKGKEFLKFDSPIAVLKFPYFSLLEKIRFGLVTLYLRLSNNYLAFEKIAASTWLKKNYGEKVYQILWEPLLKSKFPFKTEQISLSWFWARIKVRGGKLGYLKGSLKTLTQKLTEEIKKNKGKIMTAHEIKTEK
jgi:protoporphyrinogen oxidase